MTKHELYKQAGIELDYFQYEDVISRLLGGFCKDMYTYSKDIGWVYSYQDILDNKKEGKLSALLSLEDGRVMKNDLDNSVMESGLTEFGHSLVEYMQDVGMLVDVSHLSDGGFREVLEISKKTKVPFVASHSNCRAISGSPRNLTDDMIRELGNAGGVMGVNFYPVFLDNDRYKKANMNHISKVDDMVRHIIHMKKVGGAEVIAIGSDFDGCDGTFEIKDASYMYILFDRMLKAGFTMEEIEKAAYKNVLRILKDVLQ